MRRVDIDSEAPVIPQMPWYRRIAEETDGYRKSLNGVLESYGQYLTPELINKIYDVETTLLVRFPIQFLSARQNPPRDEHGRIRKYAPVLCSGGEKEIMLSLSDLNELVKEIAEGRKNLGLEK